PDLVVPRPCRDRGWHLHPGLAHRLAGRGPRAASQSGHHSRHAARPDRRQAPGGRRARVAAADRQDRSLDRGRDHRTRARGNRPARGGRRRRRDRARVATGEMEDRQPVRRDHDAHRRERAPLAGVPRRGHRRAVGRARPYPRLRRRLLLPVFPEGGLPRDRPRRRTVVVSGALAVLTAYLTGAVPVGFLIARAWGVGDIRAHGSGNIGATNVLRTAGRAPAILTLVGDVAKGFLAVTTAAAVAPGQPWPVAAAGAGAVLRHCSSR